MKRNNNIVELNERQSNSIVGGDGMCECSKDCNYLDVVIEPRHGFSMNLCKMGCCEGSSGYVAWAYYPIVACVRDGFDTEYKGNCDSDSYEIKYF